MFNYKTPKHTKTKQTILFAGNVKCSHITRLLKIFIRKTNLYRRWTRLGFLVFQRVSYTNVVLSVHLLLNFIIIFWSYKAINREYAFCNIERADYITSTLASVRELWLLGIPPETVQFWCYICAYSTLFFFHSFFSFFFFFKSVYHVSWGSLAECIYS